MGLGGRGVRGVIIIGLELEAAVAAALAGRDEAVETVVAVFFADLIHHAICLEFPVLEALNVRGDAGCWALAVGAFILLFCLR